MTKYAQPILFFFCRPCDDYHLKTHPHHAEQLARSEARRKAKDEKKVGGSAAKDKKKTQDRKEIPNANA